MVSKNSDGKENKLEESGIEEVHEGNGAAKSQGEFVRPLKSNNGSRILIGDYAACIESQSGERSQGSSEDLGVIIMQSRLDNINRLGPNIACLLLIFDTNSPVKHTILQLKSHYNFLEVILDMLENLKVHLCWVQHTIELVALYII